MTKLHLAQVNVARMRTPLEDPAMIDFVARLEEINALADRSPGFVWRLQTAEGNATYLRPYADHLLLFNMSVWESVEHLKRYVYYSAHVQVLRRRAEWFERPGAVHMALWWLPAGDLPSVDEGKKRLAYLEANGPTAFAFTFSKPFPPDPAVVETTDRSGFEPCPAS